MSSETGAAIAAVNEHFMKVFAQGDAAGMGSLYTEKGQLLPPNAGIITGPGPISEFWGGAMGMGIKEVKLSTLELDDLGSTAVETGEYRLFAEGGQALDQGTYLVVWKNDGNGWKLDKDIWNTNTPPA